MDSLYKLGVALFLVMLLTACGNEVRDKEIDDHILCNPENGHAWLVVHDMLDAKFLNRMEQMDYACKEVNK